MLQLSWALFSLVLVLVLLVGLRTICVFLNNAKTREQTWSSRDLSLGLETSQDPFLRVLVSVSVLNLGVLVLVLEPQSLGRGFGLGTLQTRSRSRSWDLRQWRLGLRHS